MIRTQIYLPQSQIKELKQIARDKNVSLSAVIRIIIEEKVFKKSEKAKNKRFINAGDALLSLARLAEKKRWEGPKDLASNVDKYLYGGE